MRISPAASALQSITIILVHLQTTLGAISICSYIPAACDGSFNGTFIDLKCPLPAPSAPPATSYSYDANGKYYYSYSYDNADPIIDGSITGTIPTELATLPNLYSFSLVNCSVSGTIPTELTNLQQLRIAKAWVSGTVPSAFTKLAALDIFKTYLSGTLPISTLSDSGAPSGLQTLVVRESSLSGTIPTELSQLTQLEELAIDTTWLSGSIPSQLASLTRLEVIGLFTSPVSGTMPHQLYTSLGRLQRLGLGKTSLSGTLPSTGLASLSNLTQLVTWKTSISGTLPHELSKLTQLNKLNAAKCSLSGTLPTELARLSSLAVFDVDQTRISGTIPADSIANLTSLTVLWLDNSRISGTVPPAVTRVPGLYSLRLWSTSLSGTVPAGLERLAPSLEELDISQTRLSGTIPTGLRTLVNLYDLDLDTTRLSGTLPPQMSQMAQLQQLSLDTTSLSGTLPPSLMTLTNLWALDLAVTPLSGTIPSSLNQLPLLTNLFLFSTRVSGTLPSGGLENLVLLTNVALNDNRLSGTIPPELVGITSLRVLALNRNSLSGTLPTTLGGSLGSLRYFNAAFNRLTYPSATTEGGDAQQLDSDYRKATAPCHAKGRAVCLGLPPVSCSAFAGGARLGLTQPDSCVECNGSDAVYIGFLLSLALGALGALVLFARLSIRNPHARKRWVSSILQLVTHCQALVLLSYLRLDWPPAISWLIEDILSLNIFNVPAGTCVFGSPHSFSALHAFSSSSSSSGDASNPSTYTTSPNIYTYFAIGTPLVVLLSLLAARTLATLSGKAETADRAELALTLVFSLLLAFGWSVIAGVINTTVLAVQVGQHAASGQAFLNELASEGWTFTDGKGTSSPFSDFTASAYHHSLYAVFAVHFTLVALLFLLLLGLAIHFACKIRTFQQQSRAADNNNNNNNNNNEANAGSSSSSSGGGGGGSGSGGSSSGGGGVGVLGGLPSSSPIAPRRLAKQVAFLTSRFAPHAPYWQVVIWTRQLALFLVALAATIMRATSSSSSTTSSTSSTSTSTSSLSYDDGARYALVVADMLITLAAWLAHHQTQPYAYRFQNSVESWLYGATASFLLLMTLYTVLEHETHVLTSLACEVLSIAALFGSLIGAAAYLAWRLRSTQRDLQSIDFGEALAAADTQLDTLVRERLADGTIRLLRCDWLASTQADCMLGRDPHSGAAILLRRQEMPLEAYFTPEEAVGILYEAGDRSILALSYRWQTRTHPDPKGTTMAAVRRFLRRGGDGEGPPARGCGLFWDFASLPQEGRVGGKGVGLTSEEADVFSLGLQAMGLFYASLTRTAVLQIKTVPACPPEFAGRVALYGLAPGAAADSLRRDVLRADAGRFGKVLEVVAAPSHGDPTHSNSASSSAVHVRFESHEQAAACVERLRVEKRKAELLWNSTAYDRSGGRPYSGWCTFEQGTARMAAAHLAQAERRAQGAGRPPLPERFARAQASRPKVVDLSSGDAIVPDASEAPEAILRAAIDDVGHARFMVTSEHVKVQRMLYELEWTMATAMEQAELAMSAGELTVDPAVERRLRRAPRRQSLLMSGRKDRRPSRGGGERVSLKLPPFSAEHQGHGGGGVGVDTAEDTISYL